MKITVLVTTNAKQPGVTPVDDQTIRVKVKSLPIDGKANDEIIKLLAKHYRVSQSQVEISHGQSGKRKLVEVDLD